MPDPLYAIVPAGEDAAANLVAPLDGPHLRAFKRVGDDTVLQLERAGARWAFGNLLEEYPALLRRNLPLSRAHDVTGVERILASREGRFGEPLGPLAVQARREGRPPPPDVGEYTSQVAGLFALADPVAPERRLSAIAIAVHDQQQRIGDDGALRLLASAESTAALAAAEMNVRGLPWDTAEHDRLLHEALGSRGFGGGRPTRMQELADELCATIGFAVNPDSPADVLRALQLLGFDVQSTRKWVIAELDHPAVPILLEYKELARLHTANGWAWQHEWVKDGRLVSEFAPGGVVTGRWATSGGGGLQLPRMLRAAARAHDDWRLIVADAAQLEPRILAAFSKDPALQAICTEEDLYTAIAEDGFGGSRDRAKLTMLGAMYGQTSGEAGRLMPVLRRRYPVAVGMLERAARTGESGGTVDTVLGRRSPPSTAEWARRSTEIDALGVAVHSDSTSARAADSRREARAWGRFTRNFVIQGSAADWASVWLACVRRDIATISGAELVFFQHDELVLHAPAAGADAVAQIVIDAARQARDLVFPGASAATPVRPVIVDDYAQAT